MRHALLASAACIAAAFALIGPAVSPASAQSSPAAQARPVDPQAFLDFGYSSAAFQARAAEVATAKDTRPEVKDFAREMAAFRAKHLRRLQALAQEQGLKLPAVKDFEHQAILENLEPLDALELSRRYAEIQVQALEQEVRAYRAAGQVSDPLAKSLVDDALPELERRLEGARKVLDGVKP